MSSESLLEIEGRLINLAAVYDNCESEDERIECELALRETLAAEVRKVDAIAYVVRQFEIWKAEAERLAGIAKRRAEAIDRIKAAVKYTLEDIRRRDAMRIAELGEVTFEAALASLPMPKLQTATSCLRIQKNGGVESVDIAPGKEGNIPDDMIRVTCEIDLATVKLYEKHFETAAQPCPIRRVSQEFHLTKIREAVKAGTEIDGVSLSRGTHLRVEGGPGAMDVQRVW